VSSSVGKINKANRRGYRDGAAGGRGNERTVGRGKGKVQTKSAGARFSDMSTEQDVASPAAAELERRQRRATQQNPWMEQNRKQDEC
jgi:hypothetical protein